MAETIIGYVSGDNRQITDWHGVPLMRVTSHTSGRSGFRDETGRRTEMHSYRAVDPQGIEWYGRGLGSMMSIRMHRAKGRSRSKGELSVPEQHYLRIVKENAKMPAAMAGVLGGPSPEEAKRILAAYRRTGKLRSKSAPRHTHSHRRS